MREHYKHQDKFPPKRGMQNASMVAAQRADEEPSSGPISALMHKQLNIVDTGSSISIGTALVFMGVLWYVTRGN